MKHKKALIFVMALSVVIVLVSAEQQKVPEKRKAQKFWNLKTFQSIPIGSRKWSWKIRDKKFMVSPIFRT